MSVLEDPRVRPHSYIVYPTGYDDCTFTDKTSYCLTVTDGHAWGWKITGGLAMQWSPSEAMNRKGEFIVESRGSKSNKFRRYPLEEALELALKYVDTINIMGRTIHEAQAWVDSRS